MNIKKTITSVLGIARMSTSYLRGRRYLNSLKKFQKVVIVCPGPSAKMFKEVQFENQDLLIFINHGFSHAKYVKSDARKLVFSSDEKAMFKLAEEYHEIASYDTLLVNNYPFRCAKYRLPHTFHKALMPTLRFDKENGFSRRMHYDSGLKPLPFFENKGVSSLISCLVLISNIDFDELELFGVDHGAIDGRRYAENQKFASSDTPFERIKREYQDALQILVSRKPRLKIIHHQLQ